MKYKKNGNNVAKILFTLIAAVVIWGCNSKNFVLAVESVDSAADFVLTQANSLEEQEAESVVASLRGIAAGTILNEEEINFAKGKKYFTSSKIKKSGAVYKRMKGKSFDEDGTVKLSDLRYLKVLHYNYHHEIQVGELVVNKAIAKDVLSIFYKLFQKEYEIKSMYLIDDYWQGNADDTDTASCEDGNTSAFCYRPMTNGQKLSKHAYGLAIDINTRENPYIKYVNGKAIYYHKDAKKFMNRAGKNKHMINHEDVCYQLFHKYGFTWGGDWKNPKDYQHFEIDLK